MYRMMIQWHLSEELATSKLVYRAGELVLYPRNGKCIVLYHQIKKFLKFCVFGNDYVVCLFLS